MTQEQLAAAARHQVCYLLRQRGMIGRWQRHITKRGPGWEGFRVLRSHNRLDLRAAIATLRQIEPRVQRPVQGVFGLGLDCDCPGLCYGHFPANVEHEQRSAQPHRTPGESNAASGGIGAAVTPGTATGVR